MEYINEFHKEWIERTRQSIASWSKRPASPEEVRKQQEKLNQQRAIREDKQKKQASVIHERPIKNQGTGSNPPEFQGWQRNIRLRPSCAPLSAPYFSTASAVYSEQLGKKRQRRPRIGLITYL